MSNIIIIHNKPTIISHIIELISRLGFNIYFTNDILDLIDVSKYNNPFIIIYDCYVYNNEISRLMRDIKSNINHIPIIFLSDEINNTLLYTIDLNSNINLITNYSPIRIIDKEIINLINILKNKNHIDAICILLITHRHDDYQKFTKRPNDIFDIVHINNILNIPRYVIYMYDFIITSNTITSNKIISKWVSDENITLPLVITTNNIFDYKTISDIYSDIIYEDKAFYNKIRTKSKYYKKIQPIINSIIKNDKYCILIIETSINIDSVLINNNIHQHLSIINYIPLSNHSYLYIVPRKNIISNIDDFIDNIYNTIDNTEKNTFVAFGYAHGPIGSVELLLDSAIQDLLERSWSQNITLLIRLSVADYLPYFSFYMDIKNFYINTKLNISHNININMERLLSITVHDTLGMMAGILGTVQLIELEEDTNEYSELVAQIKLCITLISHLRDLYGVSSRSLPLTALKSFLVNRLNDFIKIRQGVINLDITIISSNIQVVIYPKSLYLFLLFLLDAFLYENITQYHYIIFFDQRELQILIPKNSSLSFLDLLNLNPEEYTFDNITSEHQKLISFIYIFNIQNHISYDQKNLIITFNIEDLIFIENEHPYVSQKNIHDQINKLINNINNIIKKQKNTDSYIIYSKMMTKSYIEYIISVISDIEDGFNILSTIDIELQKDICTSKSSLSYIRSLFTNVITVIDGSSNNLELINVNSLIRDIIPAIERLFAHILIKTRLHPNIIEYLLPSISIKQILINLLRNAGESIAKSGEITINTGYIDRFISISITDNGIGIPYHYRDRIFELNFSTKGKGSDSGIGLYSVKSIITEIGGNIDISSAYLNNNNQLITWHTSDEEITKFSSTGTSIRVTIPLDLENYFKVNHQLE